MKEFTTFEGTNILKIEAEELKKIAKEVGGKFHYVKNVDIFKNMEKYNDDWYGEVFSTEGNHVNAIVLVDLSNCEDCVYMHEKYDYDLGYDFTIGEEEKCEKCGLPSLWGLSKFLKLKKLIVMTQNEFFSETIPSTIRNLTSLEELYLNGVASDTIIKDLTNIRTLKILIIDNYSLRSSQLELLPQLESLEILNLEQTLSREIPESICRIKSLKEIYIKDKWINKIPESIGDLQRLMER